MFGALYFEVKAAILVIVIYNVKQDARLPSNIGDREVLLRVSIAE